MSGNVIVLGGGGHAKVCIDLLIRQNYEILGYTAISESKSMLSGIAYLGQDEVILKFRQDDILLVNGVGTAGNSTLRSSLFEKFSKLNFQFATLVHDSSSVSINAEVEEGAQIMAGAIVQAGSVVGKNVIINTRSVVDHDCRIERHSHIAPGAVLCGEVTVGEHTHVGAGATIIQGIHIGCHCMVGAGSLVRKPVLDRTVVFGVPAEEANR